MRSQCLVCLLLAGLAYGQAAQPACTSRRRSEGGTKRPRRAR